MILSAGGEDKKVEAILLENSMRKDCLHLRRWKLVILWQYLLQEEKHSLSSKKQRKHLNKNAILKLHRLNNQKEIHRRGCIQNQWQNSKRKWSKSSSNNLQQYYFNQRKNNHKWVILKMNTNCNFKSKYNCRFAFTFIFAWMLP